MDGFFFISGINIIKFLGIYELDNLRDLCKEYIIMY